MQPDWWCEHQGFTAVSSRVPLLLEPVLLVSRDYVLAGFFHSPRRISCASELARWVIRLQGCSICMQTSGAADGWLLLLNCASFPEELRLFECNNLSFLSQDCSQTTLKSGKLLMKHYPFNLATVFIPFVNFVWQKSLNICLTPKLGEKQERKSVQFKWRSSELHD